MNGQISLKSTKTDKCRTCLTELWADTGDISKLSAWPPLSCTRNKDICNIWDITEKVNLQVTGKTTREIRIQLKKFYLEKRGKKSTFSPLSYCEAVKSTKQNLTRYWDAKIRLRTWLIGLNSWGPGSTEGDKPQKCPSQDHSIMHHSKTRAECKGVCLFCKYSDWNAWEGASNNTSPWSFTCWTQAYMCFKALNIFWELFSKNRRTEALIKKCRWWWDCMQLIIRELI